MADDPNKRDFRDRDRVAGDQEYEVQYFAEANGITTEQVRKLIKRYGNDRATLEFEAKSLRSEDGKPHL
jgi:hypothetical protein